MKKTIQLLLLASTLLSASKANASTFIDTFENGVIDLEVSPVNLSDSEVVAANGILGGTREIDLVLTVTDDEAFASTNLFTNNNFSHSNNTGASSIASLTYDAGGAGLGLNLFQFGDRFAIDLTDIDLTTQFEVFVVDSEGETASISSGDVSTPGDILFSFDDFVGADLSSVDAVGLISQGGLNVDIDLDAFRIAGNPTIPDVPQNFVATTPESSTILGLLFASTLGLLIRRQ